MELKGKIAWVTGSSRGIGRLAVFLCGPGGAYISGQVIRVDGGEQLSPC